MDYDRIFAISGSGMELERTRVEVSAMNLANANTLQGADGAGYRPQQVIARSGIAPSFSGMFDGGQAELAGAVVATVVPSESSSRLVYEPGNPFADDKGFLRYPGVDLAGETVTMMSAVHAYEANVAALNTARTLAMKTLDIGG